MELIRIDQVESLSQIKQPRPTIDDLIYALDKVDEARSINQYSGDELRRVIGERLDLVMGMVGLKKLPEPPVARKMISYLYMHFGYLIPAEIEIAFDLAIKGSIDVDLKHYQEFSLEYLVRVIKAYRVYKGKLVLERNRIAKASKQLSVDQEKKAAQEARKDFIALVLQYYDQFMEGKGIRNSYFIGSIYWELEKYYLVPVHELNRILQRNGCFRLLHTQIVAQAKIRLMKDGVKPTKQAKQEYYESTGKHLWIQCCFDYMKCHQIDLRDYVS